MLASTSKTLVGHDRLEAYLPTSDIAFEQVGETRLVAASLAGWDAAALKAVAAHIVERPGYLAILVGAPAPAALVVARSAGLPHDSGALLRQLVDRHGGKGGGRPELAQGGGVTSPVSDVLQSAREIVKPA